ncbi:MAG TPA: hypothetical protein VFX88_01790 [Actinomycetota bacterium]|nr:hypothetical protein [Actinomycetota bacterium]
MASGSAADRYHLTEEQAFALADETSPAFVPGAFQLATSTIKDEPRITEAIRTGDGLGWDRHHADLWQGTEWFFRPGYAANLVAVFDALHDMGDPLAAAAQVRRSLAPDGTFLLVEPAAGDRVEDNLYPVGRIFYSASLLICVPNARSQGGEGLGSQVPEATWRSLLAEAPFNRVFEAGP